MRKYVVIILSIAIILGFVLLFPSNVKAAEIDGGVITAGVTKNVNVETAGDVYCFTFTPTETAMYRFYSEGNVDTWGNLCNSAGEEITYNDDYYTSVFKNNFGIVYELEKDVTYQLHAKLYNEDATGTFDVQIDKLLEIEDGTLTNGETKVVNFEDANEFRHATFTPTETGVYSFNVEGIDTWISFNESKIYVYASYANQVNLEKDHTYDLYYRASDFKETGTTNIKFEKYTPVDRGELSLNTEYNITNNAVEYFKYSLIIDEETSYFISQEYNDNESENFNLQIYNASGICEKDQISSIGRIGFIKPGNYEVRVFLRGSATFQIIKSNVASTQNITLDEVKTIEFTEIGQRYNFTFTPTVDGVYNFYSDYTEDKLDAYGYLFDDEGKILKTHDDIGGSNRNFCVTCYLKAGNTYTFGAEEYGYSPLGSINVTIEMNTTHEHSYNSNITEPTCSEQGYTTYKCTKCGYTYIDDYVEAGHHWDSGDVTEPTCTEQGYTTHHCTRCDATNVDTYVDPLGHDWNAGDVTEPTCTEQGYTTHHCTRCDATNVDTYVDPLGHDWNAGDVTEPTCTEQGYTTHHCTRCDATNVDTYVNSLGHDWDAGDITEPTCTEQGYTTHHCTRCSKTKVDTYVKALDHTFNTSELKKATLTQDGYRKGTCIRCTESVTKTIFHPEKFTLSNTSFTYNGKTHKPSITIQDSEGYTIAPSNYTVSYSNSNSKKVGKYTITVTFKENYEGSKTLTYYINPKGTALSKVSKGKKTFTAKWKKQTTETTGYEIQYSTNKNFNSGNKTVKIKKNKTVSTTVKKLKANKTYYVRVRTYKTVSGKKYYSGWSSVKSVKTK